MLYQGVPLDSEAAPNNWRHWEQGLLRCHERGGHPKSWGDLPWAVPSHFGNLHWEGSNSLYLLQGLLVSEAVSHSFSGKNSLLVPVGCHHNCRMMRSWRDWRQAPESSDALPLLEPLSMMLLGIMFTSSATYPGKCAPMQSLSSLLCNSPGAMEPVWGRGI